jgi:hypothetical protein
LGDLDLCGDETACGHGGFGEAGLGLLARQVTKPDITLGMKTVLVSDVHQKLEHAQSLEPTPTGTKYEHIVWANPDKAWTKFGPSKVCRIIEKLGTMVFGAPSRSDTCQIFTDKPHSTLELL